MHANEHSFRGVTRPASARGAAASLGWHGGYMHTPAAENTSNATSMEEHKAVEVADVAGVATGPVPLSKWAETPAGKASTWTLTTTAAAGVAAGEGVVLKSVPSQAQMLNGELSRPFLDTKDPLESRKWPHVATGAWGRGADRHVAVVAWNASSARASVDGGPPVALEGGRAFSSVLPTAMEFAVGVDSEGRALVVQAVFLAGRGGLTVNRWTVAPRTLEVVRQKPLSAGREGFPIKGGLAVAAVDAYMEWDPETADTQKPHWYVTWASWTETVAPPAPARNARLPVRATAACISALYLHADGVTVPSPDSPFAHTLPVSSQASDWRVSVTPTAARAQGGGSAAIPTTCVWCGDVALTAWPSRTFAGFRDTTRVVAAPWSTTGRCPGPALDTPLTGVLWPRADGDLYVFVAAAAGDPRALHVVAFRTDWPLAPGGVRVCPAAAMPRRDEVEAVTSRLGLPLVRVLGTGDQDDGMAAYVAVMTPPASDSKTQMRWSVVTVPIP